MPVIEEMKVIVTVDSDQGEVGLKKFSKQIDLTASKATALNIIVQGFKFSAMIAGAGQAASGIQALGAAAFSTASALGPLSGLVTTLPAGFLALAGAGGAVVTSIKGVGDAVKASSKAQDAAIVTTADQKAGLAEMAAQAKASEQAIKNIASAEKSLVIAQENVVRAQQRLNEALKPADYITAKEAELSLRAARLEQADALADLTKLTDRYNTGLQKVSKVVTGIKDDFTGKTLEFVTEVKGEDPAEVMRQQEAARLRVEQATLNILRAEERINDVRKIGTEEDERVIAAREALAAAVEDIAMAQEGVTEAQKAYIEASKPVGQVSADMRDYAAATDAAAEAMAKLSPSAKDFVTHLMDLKPVWRELQQNSQEELFSRLNIALGDSIKILPALDHVLSGFSATVGDVAIKAGKLIGDEGFGVRFLRVMEESRGLVAKAGGAAVDFANGLSYVLDAARPVTDWLGDSIRLWGMQFEAYGKAGAETGKLNSFFERTVKVSETVLSILGDLYTTVKNLAGAAAPMGDQFLEAAEKGVEGWKEWSESAEAAAKVSEWVGQFKPVLEEAGRLVRDFALEFVKFDTKSGLMTTLEAIRKDFLPMIAEFTQLVSNSFGPQIVGLLTQATRLWMDLWKAAGGIFIFLPAFTEMARIAAWLIESVPGIGALVTAFGTLSAIKKFDAILGLSAAVQGLQPHFAKTSDAIKTIGMTTETAGAQAGTSISKWSGLKDAIFSVNGAAALAITGIVLLKKSNDDAAASAKDFADTLGEQFGADKAKTFDQFIAKQNELIKGHNDLVDATQDGHWNPADWDLGNAYNEARLALEPLIKENNEFINTMRGQEDALGRVTPGLNEISEAYGLGEQATYEWLQAQKEAGADMADTAALAEAYGAELKKAAEDGMQKLLDTSWDLVDANLAASESSLTVSNAISDYSTLAASGTASTDDMAAALNRAERAAYDAAKQGADLAATQAELEGHTLSAKDAAALQQLKLMDVANTLDPSSPLYQNILGTITKLQEFQKTYDAKLTVNAQEAQAEILKTVALAMSLDGIIDSAELDRLIRISTAVDGPRRMNLNVYALLEQLGISKENIGRRAKGGPVQAGKPYIVGENGPEVIVPPANGYVVPNSGGAGVAPIGNGQTGGITSSDVDRLVDALKEARPINLNYTSEESVTAREMAHDIAWNL